MFSVMPVSIEFLRGVLGVLAVFFAYLTGRSAVAVRKGKQKLIAFYGWVFRTLACAVVIAIRHDVDAVDIAVWTLCLAALAAGWVTAARAKEPEDLTRQIFPE